MTAKHDNLSLTQQQQDEFSHTVLHRNAPAAVAGGAGRPLISAGKIGIGLTIIVQDKFSHTVVHRNAPAAFAGGAGRPVISAGKIGVGLLIVQDEFSRTVKRCR